MRESYRQILQNSPIFSEKFSDALVSSLIPLIKERRCRPQEVLLLNTQEDDCAVYFIEKGSAEIYANEHEAEASAEADDASLSARFQKESKVKRLFAGTSFGEVSFFSGQLRAAKIRSVDFTTLQYVERQEFVELMQQRYPEDYQLFCQISDRINISRDLTRVGTVCFACQSPQHLVTQCHLVHYEADKSRIIAQHLRDIRFSC